MIDVEKRIQEINNAVSDNKLFLEYGLLSLAFFELKEYIDLVCEINRSRDNVKKTVQRVAFIPLYKKVFLAQGKKLNAILSNIKDKTLLEALQSPLFMEYRRHQPFNENMLRVCPLLDNPGRLAQMIHASGAKSTDLESPEDIDVLTEKCRACAENWKAIADKIWYN